MRTAVTSRVQTRAGAAHPGAPRAARRAPRAVAVLCALVAVLGACRDNGDRSGTASGPDRPGSAHGSRASGTGGGVADRGWTTVATLSGGGDADTRPFAVHGGAVRFVYTVQPNSTGPVPLLWSMFAQGEPVDAAHPRAQNSCVDCAGEQTDTLGAVPAGHYFLHVVTSRPWTLTVQERP